MSDRILITGATGFLGGRIARRMAAEGRRVHALGRDWDRGAQLESEGIRFAPVDLSDQPALEAACRDVKTIVHCAALSTAWASHASYHAVNVVGTANLLDAARAKGVRRFVYVSTPAVLSRFQDQFGLTENEPLPLVHTSEYGASKARAEQLVTADEEMETVIVRPKAIYGPGDTALLPRIVRAAEQGRLSVLGSGKTVTDLTHVEDVVDALCLVIDHPSPSDVYHIAGPEPVRLWHTITELLGRLGHETSTRRLKTTQAMRLAYSLEVLWRVLRFKGEPPLTRYKVAILRYSQTLDTTRARRELGFEPRVSIEEGLDTVVESLSCDQPVESLSAQPAKQRTRVTVDFAICGVVRPPACALHEGLLGRTEVPVLLGIICHPTKGLVLFDTGFGTTREGESSVWWQLYRRLVRPEFVTLEESLANRGVDIADIAAVVISHFDPDHVGGLRELPEAELYCSGPAWAAVAREQAGPSWWRRTATDTFPENLAARLHLFDPGPRGHEVDLFGDGSISAVSLPGHMPGHVGIRVHGPDGTRYLLCGDGVWMTRELESNAAVPSRIAADDRREARISQEWLRVAQESDLDLMIVPSHCAESADRFLGPAWRSPQGELPIAEHRLEQHRSEVDIR